MAPTSAECDAMLAAAARGGAALAVGLEFRFFDATEVVRDLLAGPLLGPLEAFDLRLGVVPRWPFASDALLRRETAGGGVLADYGIHLLDQLLVWLGDLEVVSYRDDARGGVEADCEIELRRSAGGARGIAEISRSRDLRNSCVFRAARATLEVGLWDPDPEITLRASEGAPLALSGRARRHDGGEGLDFHAAFVRQLADFAAAVRRERAPRVPGAEGRRSVALVESCYAARRPLEYAWE
jgi:predicted dehydrogenase